MNSDLEFEQSGKIPNYFQIPHIDSQHQGTCSKFNSK